MQEYPKIYGPYARYTAGPDKNKFIVGLWARPEFGYLADCWWLFTEKVDGTNIRIHWDGHRSTYGGRTRNAQLPAPLVTWLNQNLPEELFEQAFGPNAATLYGEGYGAGIQSGGKYQQTQQFVLFDVQVGDWWLQRDAVLDVAMKLGITCVPVVYTGTLSEAIRLVEEGVTSRWGDFLAEGIVGVPSANLLTRAGERIMVKIKTKDFRPPSALQLAPRTAGAARSAADTGSECAPLMLTAAEPSPEP